MVNQLRLCNATMRRRPVDDSFEEVCVALNFGNEMEMEMDTEMDTEMDAMCELLCFEEVNDFDFQSEPSTPTKPTVLASTNAPERPTRFYLD